MGGAGGGEALLRLGETPKLQEVQFLIIGAVQGMALGFRDPESPSKWFCSRASLDKGLTGNPE